MPILREYQERAIIDLRTCIRAGARSVVLVLPCGGGKTVTFAEIARRHVARDPSRRVLFLAHRAELISQAARKLQEAGIQRLRIITAGASTGPEDAPVTVASIPTLVSKRWRDRLPYASMVVWDEAHHTLAKSWEPLAHAYANALLLGLTATPERGDGAPLGDVFDDFVVCSTVRELTDLGWLVPCEVYAPTVAMPYLADHPADAFVQFAAPDEWKRATGWTPTGGRAPHRLLSGMFGIASTSSIRKGMIFCPSVLYAETVAQKLTLIGVPAACVHGTLSSAERAYRLRQFKSGEIRVLTNAMLLTEGYDEPSAEVVVIARGCSHAGTFLQIVGRALRPSPGKVSALLVDLRGVVHIHGMPDENRVYTLTGKVAIARSDSGAPSLQQCKVCGAVYVPQENCPRCGAATPKPKPPRVMRAPLEQIFASDSEDQKRDYFARLCETADERSYDSRWITHRYRAKYGAWPTWKVAEFRRSSDRIAGAQ